MVILGNLLFNSKIVLGSVFIIRGMFIEIIGSIYDFKLSMCFLCKIKICDHNKNF